MSKVFTLTLWTGTWGRCWQHD